MTDDLDKLLRLHGEATGGEWRVTIECSDRGAIEPTVRGEMFRVCVCSEDMFAVPETQGPADARFIAAAHNALPGLVERVRRAEAERDALREVAEAAQSVCDDSQGVDVICEGVLRKRMTTLRAALAKVPR